MNDRSPLAARYTDYLDCLNERRFDDLASFVDPGVIHNGRGLGLDGFRAMLEADVETIPDLSFELALLTVDEPHAASILAFHCTPVAAFRGLPTAGRTISFTEHAFYRFLDGRIERIWSVLDLEAVREQVSR